MKEYNGFSASKRSAVWQLQKQAIEDGILIKKPCEMCSQSEGLLMPHLEDYDDPVEGSHWLCVECHMTLHGRFSNPVRWIKLLLKLREGYICPPYDNVLKFFAESRIDKSEMPLFKPNLDEWSNRLPMSRINFNKLCEEEQLKIR